MAKHTGWLWAAGAGVVGLGAWLAFSKKASAQESEDVLQPSTPMDAPPVLLDVNSPENTIVYDDWRTYVLEGPVMSVADADAVDALLAQGTVMAEQKAFASAKARACLPMGEFVSMGRIRKGSDAALFRYTFRFLGETDMSVVQACLTR